MECAFRTVNEGEACGSLEKGVEYYPAKCATGFECVIDSNSTEVYEKGVCMDVSQVDF